MQFAFPSETLSILKPPATHGDHLEDSVLGVVFGQAMGDAIGLLTEFMTPEAAQFVSKTPTRIRTENPEIH